MMPPRPAPRSPPRAALRPQRISFRRAPVVTVVVPIGAPFMHVVAEIVESKSIRRIQPHGLRSQLPPLVVIGNHLRRRIAPRVQQTLRAAASRTLPFGFARQTIAFAGHAAQPLAVAHGLVPRYGHHGHLRMMEVCITPARRRNTTRLRKKTPVLRIRHLVSRKLKSVHPHAMHRLLIIPPRFAPHPKPTLRDAHHHRLDNSTLRSTPLRRSYHVLPIHPFFPDFRSL